jgi:hypothetical protein
MRNQEINSNIVALWDKYFRGDSDVYAPLFYDEITKGASFFVGMNHLIGDGRRYRKRNRDCRRALALLDGKLGSHFARDK